MTILFDLWDCIFYLFVIISFFSVIVLLTDFHCNVYTWTNFQKFNHIFDGLCIQMVACVVKTLAEASVKSKAMGFDKLLPLLRNVQFFFFICQSFSFFFIKEHIKFFHGLHLLVEFDICKISAELFQMVQPLLETNVLWVTAWIGNSKVMNVFSTLLQFCFKASLTLRKAGYCDFNEIGFFWQTERLMHEKNQRQTSQRSWCCLMIKIFTLSILFEPITCSVRSVFLNNICWVPLWHVLEYY